MSTTRRILFTAVAATIVVLVGVAAVAGIVVGGRAASSPSVSASTAESSSTAADVGEPAADQGHESSPAPQSSSVDGATSVSLDPLPAAPVPAGPAPSGNGGIDLVPPVLEIPVSIPSLSPADHVGPTISAPTASCGPKILFQVSVTDPSGVDAVWGSYYLLGSKHGFTSSNVLGSSWSTTILDGKLFPITSVVVHARDGAGNVSSLSVGTICGP